jgi:hypothetical protein
VHDKLITVASSDPSVPATKLRVRVHVEPLLAIQEEEDDEEEEDMHWGESKTRDFWITGKKVDEAHFAIERVTSPDLTAEVITKPEGDAVRHGIRVTIPGKAIGHSHAGVFVRTGLESKPLLKHFFEWNVLSNIEIKPTALHFVIGGDAPQEDRIVVFKSRIDGFELTAVKSLSPVFRATVQRASTANTWELKVHVVDRQALAKTQVASIELSTNDPAQPKVEFHISAGPPVTLTTSPSAASPAASKH